MACCFSDDMDAKSATILSMRVNGAGADWVCMGLSLPLEQAIRTRESAAEIERKNFI